jgi:hypothetical protein
MPHVWRVRRAMINALVKICSPFSDLKTSFSLHRAFVMLPKGYEFPNA